MSAKQTVGRVQNFPVTTLIGSTSQIAFQVAAKISLRD
jgi:hypothetical protein